MKLILKSCIKEIPYVMELIIKLDESFRKTGQFKIDKSYFPILHHEYLSGPTNHHFSIHGDNNSLLYDNCRITGGKRRADDANVMIQFVVKT